MKKYIFFFVGIIMLLLTCNGSSKEKEKKEVEDAFKKYMLAASEKNIEAIIKEHHYVLSVTWGISDEIFSKTTYTINSIDFHTENIENEFRNLKKETAIMNVTIKAPDLKKLITEFEHSSELPRIASGKSDYRKLQLIQESVSHFLKEKIGSGNFKYIENTVNVKLEYDNIYKKWKMEEENPEFKNIFFIEDYKYKGIDKTVTELSRTPINGNERNLLIKETEEKIASDKKSHKDYDFLLFLYSLKDEGDNIDKYRETAIRLIKDFPDYPLGYQALSLTESKSNHNKIIEYAEKAIEAYKNLDTNKYPKFSILKEREEPMKELYVLIIDNYRKLGEYQKAIDIFNENKKIISNYSPPANFYQIRKTLREDNEKMKSSISKEKYENNKKNLS